MPVLLIHPRRGLFRVTRCLTCGFVFQCENCDANLVVYRESAKTFSMVCHQCQTTYKYPSHCKQCNSENLLSRTGGIERLEELLKENFTSNIVRFDQSKTDNKTQLDSPGFDTKLKSNLGLTTRIYDPSIPYSAYSHIVFLQAENLLASPDYLTHEETVKQLTDLFLSISEQTEIIFDTSTPHSSFFQELIKMSNKHDGGLTLKEWLTERQRQEASQRETFGFPPFKNLILLTSHNKNKDTAFDLCHEGYKEMKRLKDESLDKIEVTPPYPARFLRRKNVFSYHTLVKFPRKFEQFSILRSEVTSMAQRNNLQIRLNPRHLF